MAAEWTLEDRTMKAARIHKYGGPDVLTYEDGVPEPVIGPDTVLIASVTTSVNPIDWKIRSGARQRDFSLELPAILEKTSAASCWRLDARFATSSPVIMSWRWPMRHTPKWWLCRPVW
jgi:NADPH:quinone reductase-like Zn-dependent oxidoreductase